MPKNIQGGKKHKKVKRVDKNILPTDVQSFEYIIAKVTKIHNKRHCDVKTMDGTNIEDIYCSMNNSVKFVKLNDLVLIFKFTVENHFVKRNNCKDKLEKKKSIIVTLLDPDKLNVLTKKFKYNYIEDKENNNDELDIIFEDQNINNNNIDTQDDKLDFDIDDI